MLLLRPASVLPRLGPDWGGLRSTGGEVGTARPGAHADLDCLTLWLKLSLHW